MGDNLPFGAVSQILSSNLFHSSKRRVALKFLTSLFIFKTFRLNRVFNELNSLLLEIALNKLLPFHSPELWS